MADGSVQLKQNILYKRKRCPQVILVYDKTNYLTIHAEIRLLNYINFSKQKRAPQKDDVDYSSWNHKTLSNFSNANQMEQSSITRGKWLVWNYNTFW